MSRKTDTAREGKKLAEALMSEAERIFQEHCDPEKPEGWLSEKDECPVYLRLVGLADAVAGYLAPRIGKEEADALVVPILKRFEEGFFLCTRKLVWCKRDGTVPGGRLGDFGLDGAPLVRLDDMTLAAAAKMAMEDLIRLRNESDLPLLYRRLREVAAQPDDGRQTGATERIGLASSLESGSTSQHEMAILRFLHKRTSYRVTELPTVSLAVGDRRLAALKELVPVLERLDAAGWVEFRLWDLYSPPPAPPTRVVQPNKYDKLVESFKRPDPPQPEPRPVGGENGWFSPYSSPGDGGPLATVVAHNLNDPRLATEIRISRAGRQYLAQIELPSTSQSTQTAGGQATDEQPAAELDDFVTLNQAAAVAGLSKRTLERHVQEGTLPRPDVPGGDGKAHKWRWRNLRPALERIAKRPLPERFPGSRIID